MVIVEKLIWLSQTEDNEQQKVDHTVYFYNSISII